MIASFSRSFIFIKTRKTASTTTEIVLSSWCSGGDICTPMSAPDEIVRLRYGGRPRNFCPDPADEAAYVEAIAGGDRRAIGALARRIKPMRDLNNHAAGTRIREILPDLWDKA